MVFTLLQRVAAPRRRAPADATNDNPRCYFIAPLLQPSLSLSLVGKPLFRTALSSGNYSNKSEYPSDFISFIPALFSCVYTRTNIFTHRYAYLENEQDSVILELRIVRTYQILIIQIRMDDYVKES